MKEKIEQLTKKGKKRRYEDLEKKIKLLATRLPGDLIRWKLELFQEDTFGLYFWIDKKEFDLLNRKLRYGQNIIKRILLRMCLWKQRWCK